MEAVKKTKSRETRWLGGGATNNLGEANIIVTIALTDPFSGIICQNKQLKIISVDLKKKKNRETRILILSHIFEEKIEWPAEEATSLKKDVQVERKNTIPSWRKLTHPNQLQAAASLKYMLMSSNTNGNEKKPVHNYQKHANYFHRT